VIAIVVQKPKTTRHRQCFAVCRRDFSHYAVGDESPTTNKLRQLHTIDTGNLGAIKRFGSFQIKTWPTTVSNSFIRVIRCTKEISWPTIVSNNSFIRVIRCTKEISWPTIVIRLSA